MEGEVFDLLFGMVLQVVWLRARNRSEDKGLRGKERGTHLERHAIVAHGVRAMPTEIRIALALDLSILSAPIRIHRVLHHSLPRFYLSSRSYWLWRLRWR